MRRGWRGQPARAGWLLATALVAGACETAPEDAITREDFVEVYVALRVAELRGAEVVIAPETRDRVLAEFGVTEEDLTGFAERHGEDMVFMQGVWSEIQNKLVELRSKPDTVG